jgi:hypothetical protein
MCYLLVLGGEVINMPNSIPTLQDLIEQSGIDPAFFDKEGGIGSFADFIGLKGKGREGFQSIAGINPFNPKTIEDLLSSLGEFRGEQRGMVQDQFGSGLSSLRSGLSSQLMGARQQTGGFAGSGAQQRGIGLIGEAAQRQLGGLEQSRKRGFSGIEQQVESRVGQTQGLLGDYISRLTGLGSQFLAMDPTSEDVAGGLPKADLFTVGNIDEALGGPLTDSQEERLAKQEGWVDAASKKRWMDAGANDSNREEYGWKRPSGG